VSSSKEPGIAVIAADMLEEILPYMQAWQDLAADAVEENVFYESWMLIPAFELLRGSLPVQLAMVRDERGEECRLLGVFPLERRPAGLGPLGGRFRLWRHQHCFLCTPLVRRGCFELCFDSLFRWIGGNCRWPAAVAMEYVRGDGDFDRAFGEYVRKRGLEVDETRFERALLDSKMDGEDYLRSALSNKSRREFERQGRRLAEQGRVEIRSFARGDSAAEWVDALLELEARGWKGRAKTAMACREAEASFFRRAAAGAAERGRLLMQMLRVEDRPIAVHCSVLGPNGGSYALKIAYDEQYAKYSPGVQLEFEVLKGALSRREAAWMD